MKIIDSCFPKSHSLHSVLNRNTVKLSYSCMPNMEAKVASHNKKLLRPPEGDNNPPPGIPNCSCPKAKKEACPLQSRCLDNNIIYQASVHSIQDNCTETYVGLTATSFKDRLATHNQSIKFRDKNQTTLSKHIWSLKDRGKEFKISYKIIGRGIPYSPKFKSCNLCIREKAIIITQPEKATLNKRTELTSKCLHQDKHSLARC